LGSHIWEGHAGPAPYDFRKSSYADTTQQFSFWPWGAI
jgi:hypothetical protein